MTFHRLTHALLQGKPYFGSALRALQGDPIRHQYFEPAVRRAAGLNKGKAIDILEIGSWAGASAVTWARALQAVGCGGSVTCIDTWAPYFDTAADSAPHYHDMDEAAQSGEIYRLFLHNIEASGVSDIVAHHVIDSRSIGSLFEPGSFSIVYIDGNHALDFVRSDIATAKDLVRANGIVCGDDLELTHGEVQAVAHREQLKLGVDFAFSEKPGAHYHPGVTEAVHEAFGAVTNCAGFWAAERQGESWAPAELDTANATLPDHIRASLEGTIELVDEVGEFNIVSARGRFAAVARTLGHVDVFNERVGERDLASLVLTGESADEVLEKARNAVSAMEAANAGRAAGEQRWAELSKRVDALSTGIQEQIVAFDHLIGATNARIEDQTKLFDAALASLAERVVDAGARIEDQTRLFDAALASLAERVADAGARIEDRMNAHASGMAAALDALRHETGQQAADDAARISRLDQRLERIMQNISRLYELSAEAALTQAALARDFADASARIDALDEDGKRASAETLEVRRLLAALTQEVIDADDRIDDLTRLHASSLAQRLRNLFRIEQVAAE